MQQTNLTKYAKYLKEKIGAEVIEWENAWASYFIGEGYLFICDMWVDPMFRQQKIGSELLGALCSIAKENHCKHIRSSVMVNSADSTLALLAQIRVGFVVTGSNDEKIFLVKEI